MTTLRQARTAFPLQACMQRRLCKTGRPGAHNKGHTAAAGHLPRSKIISKGLRGAQQIAWAAQHSAAMRRAQSPPSMLSDWMTNSSWLQGLWKKADSHVSFQILQAGRQAHAASHPCQLALAVHCTCNAAILGKWYPLSFKVHSRLAGASGPGRDLKRGLHESPPSRPPPPHTHTPPPRATSRDPSLLQLLSAALRRRRPCHRQRHWHESGRTGLHLLVV